MLINSALHLKWEAEDKRISENGNLIKDKMNTDILSSELTNNDLKLKCSLIHFFMSAKYPEAENSHMKGNRIK